MRAYRFELVDDDRQPVGLAGHDCNDDLSALEFARTLCRDYAVEIWDGTKLIAHLNCGDRDHTSAQAQSG